MSTGRLFYVLSSSPRRVLHNTNKFLCITNMCQNKYELTLVFSAEREFDVFFSYSSNLKDTKDGKRFLSVLHDWFEVSNFNVFDQHRGHAGGIVTLQSRDLREHVTVTTNICNYMQNFIMTSYKSSSPSVIA